MVASLMERRRSFGCAAVSLNFAMFGHILRLLIRWVRRRGTVCFPLFGCAGSFSAVAPPVSFQSEVCPAMWVPVLATEPTLAMANVGFASVWRGLLPNLSARRLRDQEQFFLQMSWRLFARCSSLPVEELPEVSRSDQTSVTVCAIWRRCVRRAWIRIRWTGEIRNGAPILGVMPSAYISSLKIFQIRKFMVSGRGLHASQTTVGVLLCNSD